MRKINELFELSDKLNENVRLAINDYRKCVENILVEAMKEKDIIALDVRDLHITKLVYYDNDYHLEEVENLILRDNKIVLDYFLYDSEDKPIIDDFSKLDYYNLLSIMKEIQK